MKLDERLANMSVNHKAQICNRMMRKIYPGTPDVQDMPLSEFAKEYDNNPQIHFISGSIFRAYGIDNHVKATDYFPHVGIFVNPIKCETEIDNSIKYYLNRILNHE